MLTLAIETSCDETALAIVDHQQQGTKAYIADLVSSQVKLHQDYGGVVPELAAREHLKILPLLYRQILQQAQISSGDLGAICVTAGPGLKGCLLIGISFAEGLALSLKLPCFAVNHIEGHVLAPLIENEGLDFPYLALVVSGGHTEIVKVDDIGKYEILARTIDDAAGEAFDKSANLLGFNYPGGAELATLADTVSNSNFKFPRMMLESDDFSFSGLKTAISLVVAKQLNLDTDIQLRADICHAIQAAIIDNLILKLKKARAKSGVEKVAITGGVAANFELRRQLLATGWPVYFPSNKFCTDNAVMIAFAQRQRYERNMAIKAPFKVLARWPVESI